MSKLIVHYQFTKSVWSFKAGITVGENDIFALGGFYFAHTEPVQRFDKNKYWYFEIYPPQMVKEGKKMFTIGFNTEDHVKENR